MYNNKNVVFASEEVYNQPAKKLQPNLKNMQKFEQKVITMENVKQQF